MTQAEFQSWVDFYSQYPFDDMHRFHRPASLIAQSMRGGDIKPLIDWLQPPSQDDHSDADLSFLKAFGLKTEK